MQISLSGDVIAKYISASTRSLGTFGPRRVYDLVRVHLIKVGCPGELAAARENKLNLPIVVERNRREFGLVKSIDYFPKAVMVCGGYRRDQLLARGILNSWGWVERGTMEILAEDAIGAGALLEKLSGLLQAKFYGNNKPINGQAWPVVTQVFPFENYLLCEFGGRKIKQSYALDPFSCDVSLKGDETIMHACGGMGLPRTQSGMRQVNNPMPLAGNQTASFPNPDADLIRMVIRNVGNVDAVVSKMLAAMKMGLYKPLKPDFAPVNLSDDGKILGPLVEAGIDPVDFVRFVESREFSDQQRKSLAKTGAAMPGGGFPIKNRSDLKNAVRAFGRAKNPSATKKHIIKRAKSLGAMDILPDDWQTDIKSFGRFHTKKHRSGDPKKVSFRV